MASELIIRQKEEKVRQLAEKIKESEVAIIVDYKGITVEEVTKLRADLRKMGAEYAVIKNNLTKRALAQCGIEDTADIFIGTTALVIGKEDYLAPAKTIYKYSKEHDNFKIKAAVLEGKLITSEEIITLAKLPSREELIAKLAGVLLANISKLAVAVDQVRIQKEAE